ncbi:MAG: tetratricopeptide repeat protein [Gemmatimonadaceae bacterium]
MSNRLQLLGGATIETPAGPLSGRAAQRHRVALLALLASTRRPGRNRDQLVATLWPDTDSERGRHLLSDSVYRINQALGDDAIIASGDDLRLNAALLPSDLGDFERAMLSGDHLRAIDTYGGPFLDGFFVPNAPEFDRWMEDERARYATEVGRAMEALAQTAEREGKQREAVDWWRRLAGHAPDNSRVALRYMQALASHGDRGAAIKHGQLHATLLRESLGVAPDPAVEQLVEMLRDTTPAGSTPVAVTTLAVERPEQLPSPAAAPTVRPTAAVRATYDRRSQQRRATDRSSKRRVIPVLATLALVAVLLGLWRFGFVGGKTEGTPSAPAIAVLPFRNLSASDSATYFADGMTEELIYMMTRSPDLRVSSRTSVFAFKDSTLDVREIARRLGVGWVVEGSVRREGDRLRITAELANAADGYQMWSETFDRTLSDVFAIQEEIAEAIVRRVLQGTVGFPHAESQRVERGAADPKVYDLYLEGRFHWHRRSEDGLRRAAALFEQAVERAPDYARGWVGLGDAYAVIGFYDHMKPTEAFPRAENAARRALAIDPTLASAHATLGYVNLYYHWNWPVAEREFRKATELLPTYSTAHQWLANLLTARGRFAEAEQEMRIAQQTDPLSLIASAALGWIFVHANQNDRAVEQLHRTLALDPNFQLAHLWMGIAEDQRGRSAEAIRALQRAVTLSGGSPLALSALARAHATAGNRDSARSIVDSLRSLERRGRYIPSFELAKALVALGDTAGALARLERAFTDRAHSMAFLEVDPQLAGIRAHPRYRALREKVGR